ncbi:hypothetical protein K501DRAFT_161128, partial [Backusella circina FSU 941]
FANDTLFEHNRYTTTKKQNNSATPLKYDSRINIIDEQPKKSIITKNRKKSSHIRHYSHVSCMSASNITVNSENLTAKEFADIAGIRILSEDEEYSSSTFQSFNSSDNYTSHSSPLDTIQDADHDLNIWDVNFWQQPGDDLQQVSSPHLHQNEEPPILHQLRRRDYNLSSNQQDTIIRKGRFEIHLSHCNHSNTISSTSS